MALAVYPEASVDVDVDGKGLTLSRSFGSHSINARWRDSASAAR
jgi:hypothetical protein